MTKVISISDEAYRGLSGRKKGKDSFTKVILRLLRTDKPDIMKFYGMWKDDPEVDEIYEKIIAERHADKGREVPEW